MEFKGKNITYSEHLETKLNLRSISYELPETVYKQAQERYYDMATKHNVALKEVEYKGKLREMIVSYDEIEDEVNIITIHPIKPHQKINRIRTGRWHRI